MPIHAEPSASARMTSLFCDASLRTFGLSSFRYAFARESSALPIEYGFLLPVARAAIASMSVGMFSSEIFPLYFLSRSACHESGFTLTYFGL
jgi:hypothetical protein